MPLGKVSGKSVITIPANQTHVTFYYKGSSEEHASLSPYQERSLRVATASGLTAVNSQLGVSVRTPGAPTRIVLENFRETMAVNDCREIRFWAQDANGVPSAVGSNTNIIPNLSQAAGLSFRADCGGGATVTQVTIPNGASQARVAIKATDASSKKVTFTLSPAGLALPDSLYVNPPIAADHVALMDDALFAGMPAQSPDCRPLKVMLMNAANAMQGNAMGSKLTLKLRSNPSGIINFYSTPDCAAAIGDGQSGAPVEFDPGQAHATVYWNAQPTFYGSQVHFMMDPSPFLQQAWMLTDVIVNAAPALNSLGYVPQSQWRMPRRDDLGLVSISSMNALSSSSINRVLSAPGAIPQAGYIGIDGRGSENRRIAQMVMNFTGAESLTADLNTGGGTQIFSDGPFTIALFFRVDANGSAMTLFSDETGDVELKMLPDGSVRFLSCTFTFHAVNDGKWHSVLASRDATNCYLSVDGSIDAGNLQPLVTTDRVGFTTLNFANRNAGATPFHGQIADILYFGANQYSGFYTIDQSLQSRYLLLP
ncbi:MAG: hypothetical protein KF865_04400 [Bdellovibrionaceae bacterium]|nr:hypothetical protein [Pseudobdellovibrionaceae bacterium]